MLETFQTIINAGGYDLADLTERIKTICRVTGGSG